MPSRLLKQFKSRMTLPPESDSARDTTGTSAEHRDRCWYKKPGLMLDFWNTLIAALERIAMLPSLIHKALPSLTSRKRVRDAVRTYDRTMDDLLREVQRLLEAPLDPAQLLHMSGKLHDEFAPKLAASDICMLPSYNDKLPTGREQGTYLALDVGGSTFRVAVVELNGHKPGAKSMRIVNMKSYKIDNSVRYLQGTAFFDWMAEKIETAIMDPQVRNINGTTNFSMGLAWSFPVEYVTCYGLVCQTNRCFRQTSIHSGNLLAMGKGFRATEGTLGQDLCELIMAPCRKRVRTTSTPSTLALKLTLA
jgi:hexokinase